MTALATAIVIPKPMFDHAIRKTGIYAFIGLSNLILAKSNDYFAPIADFNPYTHTWSLGVEEQFYFVFPLLFFAWTQRGRWRRLTVGLFGAGLVVSLAYSAWLGQSDKVHAFYGIAIRFWQLATGALLFQAMRAAGRRFDVAVEPTPRWFTAGAGLSLVLSGHLLQTAKPDQFPYPGAVSVVLGTLAFIFFLHGKPKTNPLVRCIGNRPALFVGRISYSLYLWHWPVFVVFRWTFGLDSTFYKIAASLIAVAMAVSSYYYVERPTRRLAVLKRLPQYVVVAVGIGCLALCSSAAVLIHWLRPHISISTVSRHLVDWEADGSELNPQQSGCTIRSTRAHLGISWVTTYTRQNCQIASTGPRIFAIGDSHTLSYVGLFKQYVMHTGSSVTVYANVGCAFLPAQAAPRTNDCRVVTQQTFDDALSKLRQGDIVFLSSLRMPRFSEQYTLLPQQNLHDQVFDELVS